MFKKFPHISNDYQINVARVPFTEDMEHMKFIAEEKLDGANISFIFKPNGSCVLASRQQILGDWKQAEFFNVQSVFEDDIYNKFVEHFSNKAKEDDSTIQIYGELIGNRIMRRVFYGEKSKILFYDCLLDGDDWLTPKEFKEMLTEVDFESLLVPEVWSCIGLVDALSGNNTFQSLINKDSKHFFKNNPENIAEGVVIKPYEYVITSRVGERFLWKSKNKDFSEKHCKTASEKVQKEIDPEEQEARLKFLQYINENRVLSYFSKVGKIEKPSQMGDYIRAILEDAEQDFLEDNNTWITKNARKSCVKSASAKIANLLKVSMSCV